MLGDRRPERLGDVLPFGDHLIRQAERLLEDEADPLPVDRRVRPVALLVVLPLLEGQLDQPGVLRVVRVEPLREHPLQHRDREERPGDLDQREPFVVVAGGMASCFVVHSLGQPNASVLLDLIPLLPEEKARQVEP